MNSVWLSDGSILQAEYIYIGLVVSISNVERSSINGELTLTAGLVSGRDYQDPAGLLGGFLGTANIEKIVGEPLRKESSVSFALPLGLYTLDKLTNMGVGCLPLDSGVLVEVIIDGVLHQFSGGYDDYCKMMSNLQKFGLFVLQDGWEERDVNIEVYLDNIEDLRFEKITVLECNPREYYTH